MTRKNWKILTLDMGEWEQAIIDENCDDNKTIALTQSWENARLIANAPEMLSVLKNVYASMTILDEHYKREPNNTTIMLRDIIAKAEGGVR